MSRVGVGVSVISAAILTLIAAMLYRTPDKAAVPAPAMLVPFDARHADALEVITTQETVAARRAGRSLDWWIMVDQEGHRRIWPASQQRVRGALRILADMQPRAADTQDFMPDATLTISAGEEQYAAQLEARTFAGRGAIRPIGADATVYSVPSALNDMVLRPGPASWREPLVFGDLRAAGASDVNRIGLTTQAQSLLLARVQGRWWIHPDADLARPGLRADPAAVQALLKSLAETRVDQFIDDDRDPDELGLAEPTAILTIEGSRRLPSGERRRRLRELRLGYAAALGTQSVFGVLDDTGARDAAGSDLTFAPQLLAVDAAGLATLAMNAPAYMSRTAIDVPASDIGRVVISDLDGQPFLDITRTLEGWRLTGADSPPTREEANAVESLLSLASEAKGQPALTGDAAVNDIIAAELSDLGGTVIASLTFGLAADGEEMPVLSTDRALRLYDIDAADQFITWLIQATSAP